MSIKTARLQALLPKIPGCAHARFLRTSGAIGARAERRPSGAVNADSAPYLAYRRIEAYVRDGNRRELRAIRKDTEWYVWDYVCNISYFCITPFFAPSSTLITTHVAKTHVLISCAPFCSPRIPAILQGRGAIPDRLLRMHKAPLLRDWETGMLARQRKGKVKFCGPLYELRVLEGESNAVQFEKLRVLPNNILIHPITNHPISVTFVHRPVEEPVRVRVPIRYLNGEKCPGLRNAGYVNRLHWDIDIVVQPFVKPPTFATVDLAGLQLKEKRFVKDLAFDGKDAGCNAVLAEDVPTTMISHV